MDLLLWFTVPFLLQLGVWSLAAAQGTPKQQSTASRQDASWAIRAVRLSQGVDILFQRVQT